MTAPGALGLDLGGGPVPCNRSLHALLTCDTLLPVAQMIGYLAVPWWIAREGGAGHLALYGLVLGLATLAALPLLAPLSERHAKHPQMVLGLVLMSLAALAFAVQAGFANYGLWHLMVIGCVSVLADTLVSPTSTAIAAELVSPAQLPALLQRRKAAQSLGRLVGPVVGGSVLAFAGVAWSLWLQCVLFVLVAMAALRMPSSAPVRTGPGNARGFARWWADLAAGARAKWAVPIERGWTAVNFGVWIFIAPAVGMLVPLKVQSLGLSAAWLGACEAALSAGMLVGSHGGLLWLVARFGRLRVRVGAAVLEGLALATAGFAQEPLLLVAAYFCTGCANSAMVLVGATHRSLAVPQDFRVRMAAANIMASQVAGAIGLALGGWALLHWTVAEVYGAFGLTASVLALSFFCIPRAKEFFELDHPAVVDWYRLQYPLAFRAATEQQPKPT